MKMTLRKPLVYMLVIAIVIAIFPMSETKAKTANVTVTTKAALYAEMEKPNATTITFKNKKIKVLTIEEIGVPYNKILILNCKKAKITNKAPFKTVKIKAAKNYTEKISGNTIEVLNSKTLISVYKKIKVDKLTVPTEKYMKNVKLSKKAKIAVVVYADAKETTTPDPTTVEPTKTEPTNIPTTEPTKKPTETPTIKPSKTPTNFPAPTVTETPVVTTSPTPVVTPTVQPTTTPAPTVQPTVTTQPTVQPTVTTQPTVQPTVTTQPTVEPTKPAKPDDNYFWDEDAGTWVAYENTLPIYWENGKPRKVYIKDGLYMYWSLITDEDTAISESSIDYPDNWDGNWPSWLILTSAPTPEPTLTQQPTTTPLVTPDPTPKVTPEPTLEPHTHTWVDDTYQIPVYRPAKYHSESFNICTYCKYYLGKNDEECSVETPEKADAHNHDDSDPGIYKLNFGGGIYTYVYDYNGQTLAVSTSNGGTRYIFDEDSSIYYDPAPIKRCSECGEIDYGYLKELYVLQSVENFNSNVSGAYEFTKYVYELCGINKTPETYDSAFTEIRALISSW